jgi:hypothetical protein
MTRLGIILLIVGTIIWFLFFRKPSYLYGNFVTECNSLLDDPLTSPELASVVKKVIYLLDESRRQLADMKPRLGEAYQEATGVEEFAEMRPKVDAFFKAADDTLSSMRRA